MCSSSYSLRSIASNRAPSPSVGICKTVLVTYTDCDKPASLARAAISSRSAGEIRSDSIAVFSAITNSFPIRRAKPMSADNKPNVMQSAKTRTRHPIHRVEHGQRIRLARAREALVGETPPNRATNVGQAARFRRLASESWAAFQTRGSTIRQSPACLYSASLQHPREHGRMPAESGRRVAHRAAVAHELERAANLSGRIRLDLDAARSRPPVAVRQPAALRPRPRLPLGLRTAPRRHAGDDHAAIVGRQAVADRVDQQRGGIAQPRSSHRRTGP